MTSATTYLKSENREEQLLASLRKTLDSKNYSSWGSLPSTNSFKELLITSAVDMESTTDTNVTALCTVDTEPVESVDSFERLHHFCVDCDPAYMAEISQVLLPVFIHIYLDLVAGGHSGTADTFFGKFSTTLGSTHQSEVRELADIVSAEQVDSCSLSRKFRNQKFCLRMSNKAFQLLIQFLQVCQTPGLLSLIQRHLTIEVYGNTPVTCAADNTGLGKSELKKGGHALNFFKPKIPPLETRVRGAKKKTSSYKNIGMSDSSWMTMGSTTSHMTSGFTMATNEDSGSIRAAHRSEFRETLAISSQELDPSSPSLVLYTVHTSHDNIHCASLSPSSKTYACGYGDSSIHTWSQLPVATSQKAGSDHHVLHGHHGPVYGTSFDSSGQYLLSCSEDCSIRLWDSYSRSSKVCYRGHSYPVWDVVFSPVDVYFASTSLDRTARLWSTDLVFPLRIFAGHTASVDVVRFHCNGKYIATGSCDHTCRMWDIQTGQCVRLMAGSKSPITELTFSPNGKLLVSGDENGTVRIWDLGTGGIIKEFYHPPQGVTLTRATGKIGCGISSLDFSPDSSLLASSTCNNQIIVWDMKNLDSGGMVTPLVDIDSKCSAENTCKILQLNFTHRNCIVAIATETPKHLVTNVQD